MSKRSAALVARAAIVVVFAFGLGLLSCFAGLLASHDRYALVLHGGKSFVSQALQMTVSAAVIGCVANTAAALCTSLSSVQRCTAAHCLLPRFVDGLARGDVTVEATFLYLLHAEC